ncbi:transaldolase [Nannochloropsis oceanica]
MSAPKKTKHVDQFTALGELTTLVCDTGDVEAIKRLKPTDATTNPSLIYKAASQPQYLPLVQDAVAYGKALSASKSDSERLAATMDRLAVNFGAEITKIVPGYVSTEVDARLSYDTGETLKRGRRIIEMYKELGIDKSRILIKIASTWEGIKAAEVLEKEGVATNLTLLFSLAQAAAAAEAGATLISPFVGRILDWWKKETGKGYADPEEDPGVQSVRQIYGYYKKFGYDTIVMGASFRNKGEITALAGCDRLTISPGLLDELKECHEPLPRVLDPRSGSSFYEGETIPVDEKAFRLALNNDPMATAKLAEGIRGFAADIEKLEAMIAKMLVPPPDQLSQLAAFTTIVCDTGDVETIGRLKPTDATTNPSLIFKAASLPQYQPLVDSAIAAAKAVADAGMSQKERLDLILDRLAVNFGAEITKIVPGYVSTEVDARLSYDTEQTLARAKRIVGMYKDLGIDKSRILIKIASTWEGIKAAEVLEKEGVKTNLTLLFSLAQAVAAAEAGATLISPFVGRILDWWKKETGKRYADLEEDPGVQSVRQIYGYYKKFGYDTIVMGASFRNKGEITALAGCDRLTISPGLLDELKACCDPLPRMLEPSKAAAVYGGPKLRVDEKAFRLMMNGDAMATDKLAEGIRGFAADIEKLEAMIAKKL